MKQASFFETEAALCAAFIEWAKPQGWVAYAETEGWDILLVAADGTQIGVQAKLKFNLKVLSQAVESGMGWNDVGPDFRAVLVPQDQGDRELCDALGLTLIRNRSHWDNKTVTFEPELGGDRFGWSRWHFRNPGKRHELPAYVPDVAAGVPSPSSLTRWKVAALRISALLEIRGYVTRQDFRNCDIDHRRWTDDWLEPVPGNAGAWRWLKGENKGFALQHPTIYAKVLEEVRLGLSATPRDAAQQRLLA